MATPMATARRNDPFASGQTLPGRTRSSSRGNGAGTRQLVREIADFFQHENGALRAAADELENALLHASGSNYRRVQEAVATFRLLCARFEEET